jgi:hypothetical protein
LIASIAIWTAAGGDEKCGRCVRMRRRDVVESDLSQDRNSDFSEGPRSVITAHPMHFILDNLRSLMYLVHELRSAKLLEISLPCTGLTFARLDLHTVACSSSLFEVPGACAKCTYVQPMLLAAV